jgi:hypothetical protein
MGEHVADVNRFLGPVSNGVLAILVAIYVWRLITHKGDPEAETGR